MPTKPDVLAKQALDSGRIWTNSEQGAVYYRNGQRAEKVDKRLGYGRVIVWNRPYTLAMAHRIIWIAEYGLIPDGLHINHINRRPWDNRLTNLELVSPTGNARHWRGKDYDAVSEAANVPIGWLDGLEHVRQDEQANPFKHSPETLADWAS